jgi:hypothetical protein
MVHVRPRNLFNSIEKCTDLEWFQSFASDLVFRRIQINSEVEADKAVHDFAACIDSAYRLSTCKVALSDMNSDFPGLDGLLEA